MKILNGTELASFIKQRQAKQVRALRQAHEIAPKLVIIKTINDPVIEMYVRLKKKYGHEIAVAVDIHQVSSTEIFSLIENLNDDSSIHGIIVQLPVDDPKKLDGILNSVSTGKDVDGLAKNSDFTPATPMAISWMLDGYNIDLVGKNIALIGRGRLVGAPLERLLISQGLEPVVYEDGVENLEEKLLEADIIISATGSPGLIESSMLKKDAVAIDAGVASEGWKTVGDFADSVYERDDLVLTPKRGGVGPLTVAALFDNVIRAASRQVK